MTSDMKAALLDMHNKFRNQQAMGQTPNYKPATRMATLVIFLCILVESLMNLSILFVRNIESNDYGKCGS